MKSYDIIIIGAGVTGSAIARELSKRKRKIAVLEKCFDVGEGSSKANSGIVHAGFDAKPDTLKALLNVQGNKMMAQKAQELDFSFRQNGSIVLCFDKKDMYMLEELKKRGECNGVEGIRILSSDEVLEREPNVSKDVVGALFAPTGGIVCPFEMNIAYGENAVQNGVEFHLNNCVRNITREVKQGEQFYIVETNRDIFEAKIIINAAGVYADEIHNMVSDKKLRIVPRRGQYCLMDKKCGNVVNSTIFQLPTRLGKGVLVTPTVHGNLLVGPNAEDIEYKDEIDTTREGLSDILSKGEWSVPKVKQLMTITSFAGLRAHLDEACGVGSDFYIKESEAGFFDVAGIESPGLTSAPAIGEYVANMINKKYPAGENLEFVPTREGIKSMANASIEERRELIRNNAAYGNVICRCEFVTEGEIIDAIKRPLGARTVDGVKRRVRAQMGRCQGGFCSPKILEILARELQCDIAEIRKNDEDSRVLAGYLKGYKNS